MPPLVAYDRVSKEKRASSKFRADNQILSSLGYETLKSE